MHQSLHRIRKQRPQADIQLSKLRKGQLLPLTDTENILFSEIGLARSGRLLRHHVLINGSQNDIYPIQTGA